MDFCRRSLIDITLMTGHISVTKRVKQRAGAPVRLDKGICLDVSDETHCNGGEGGGLDTAVGGTEEPLRPTLCGRTSVNSGLS